MNFINEETTTDEMDEVIHDAVFAEKKAIIAHARKTKQKPSVIAKKLINQIRIALADDKSLTNFSQFRQKATQLVDTAVNNNFQDPGKASKTNRKAVVKTTTTDKNVSPLATRLSKNLKRDDKWDGKEYTARLVDKEGKVVYQGSAKGPIERSRSKAINRMNASMPPVSDLNETSKIFENYFKQNLNENLATMANDLARALAKFRDQDNSNVATLDIDNIPEDFGMEKEKEIFRQRPAFRAAVRKRVKNFLSGVSQIDVLEPQIAGPSDPIDKLKDHYRTTTRGIKENFEKTPFGQIVADEVNKAVNELDEIKLARQVLSEQEMLNLGKQVATSVLQQVRDKMVESLPEMVEEILSQVMSEMGT
jgi:hypothetical protein